MSAVKDIDLGFKAIPKRIMALGRIEVQVGLFKPGEEELAFHAVVNEFGTSDGRIPERPAWRNAIDGNTRDYANIMGGVADLVVEGKLTPFAGLAGIGARVQRDIQRSIAGFTTPGNEPSTIAQKGKNDPLVDTGDTLEAIDHQVVPV